MTINLRSIKKLVEGASDQFLKSLQDNGNTVQLYGHVGNIVHFLETECGIGEFKSFLKVDQRMKSYLSGVVRRLSDRKGSPQVDIPIVLFARIRAEYENLIAIVAGSGSRLEASQFLMDMQLVTQDRLDEAERIHRNNLEGTERTFQSQITLA